MTNTTERYKSLVDRLYNLTLTKKVEWSNNNFESELRCQLSKYYVVLNESQDAEGVSCVSLSVQNMSGEAIDHFTDQTLSSLKPENKLIGNYWRLMSDLLHQASRQASGADDALDEILDDLSDKEIPF